MVCERIKAHITERFRDRLLAKQTADGEGVHLLPVPLSGGFVTCTRHAMDGLQAAESEVFEKIDALSYANNKNT